MARDNQSVLDYFSFPIHFCFFFFVFMFVLGLSWYINYESALEDMIIKVKICLCLVPLFLLLLVHCLSGSPTSSLLKLLPQERHSLHRAGGSPWGVALLLLLVLFLIPYQSSFHKRWFLDYRNH